MTIDDASRLRNLLGEPTPEGVSDIDTLFTDDEIADLLDRHGTPGAASAEGWEIKAAKLSTLCDVAEGDTRESLSQTHKQALAQAEYYRTHSPTGSTPSTTMKRLVRPGWQG